MVRPTGKFSEQSSRPGVPELIRLGPKGRWFSLIFRPILRPSGGSREL